MGRIARGDYSVGGYRLYLDFVGDSEQVVLNGAARQVKIDAWGYAGNWRILTEFKTGAATATDQMERQVLAVEKRHAQNSQYYLREIHWRLELPPDAALKAEAIRLMDEYPGFEIRFFQGTYEHIV